MTAHLTAGDRYDLRRAPLASAAERHCWIAAYAAALASSGDVGKGGPSRARSEYASLHADLAVQELRTRLPRRGAKR